MDIQEMLRALLKNGYTEVAIARGAQVNQSTISRILTGKIRDPKASVAMKISLLLSGDGQKAVSSPYI